MKKSLIIFGAGGLGREIKTIIDILPEWNLIGFCDDGLPAGSIVMGVPVLGNLHYLRHAPTQHYVIVAIGNPQIKSKIVKMLHVCPFIIFPTIIHPSVIFGDSTSIKIGKGSVVTAGCILTTTITVGDQVLLNLKTTVGHDTCIGAYTSVMPGVNIAGNVTIGEQVMIGSGANVLNNIIVESKVTIGAGAVVTRNVAANETVVGVPAKRIQHGE